MTSQNLTLFQKVFAYLLFVSIVIRFVHCQLTKTLHTEKQFQEFRYYSYAGFIGFIIVLLVALTTEIVIPLLIASWLALFTCAALLERYLNLSEKFKD